MNLEIDGYMVLCLADRNPETAAGVFVADGEVSIRVDIQTLFVVNPATWSHADEGEQLLVFIPGPLGGADVQLRAPKRLFREVQIPTREESNGRT